MVNPVFKNGKPVKCEDWLQYDDWTYADTRVADLI